MNELQIFNYDNKIIRSQLGENGDPLWVARDLCEILGLGDTSKALKAHPDDETNSVRDVDSQGREVSLLAVNESGLYRLVFKSRKIEAERFRKFVFNEILPSIRKSGSFSTEINEKAQLYPAAEPVFKSLHSVAQLFLDDRNQALLYANKATRRETGVDFQDVLQIELKSETQVRCFTPTELGQRINISAQNLNKELENLGFQEKKNNVWCATATGKSHSLLLDAGKKHSDGTPIQQLKWYESVLDVIR